MPVHDFIRHCVPAALKVGLCSVWKWEIDFFDKSGHMGCLGRGLWKKHVLAAAVVVVAVVMMSPSGNCLYEGTEMSWKDEEFHKTLNPEGSISPSWYFTAIYWLGHHSGAAVVAHSWRIVNHCQTIDVDGCWHTVKLQLVLRLCSGFYRSKDPTNSIKVLKEVVAKSGDKLSCMSVSMYNILCVHSISSRSLQLSREPSRWRCRNWMLSSG